MSEPKRIEPAQLPSDTVIEPFPVPFTADVQIGTAADGTKLVVLIFSLPTGQVVLFSDPQFAQTFGGKVRAAGKQAASPLLVPSSSDLLLPGGGR